MFIKNLCLFLTLISSATITIAQKNDSLTVVKANWLKERIAPQTKLYTHHFTNKSLFEANQNITYIEVKNGGKKNIIQFAFDKKELLTTSNFATKNKAIAAINGTFFDMKNGGSVDYIKVDGQVINLNRLEANQKRAMHQKAALTINDGLLSIHRWNGEKDWENTINAENIMLSGPLLRYNHQDEKLDSSAFNKLRHPRTAIGIKLNGNIILLTVDGRQDNAAGMSLFELNDLMRWLGCTSAINLDGGGSTTFWAKKNKVGTVINFPSDNKQWDHEGERKVANVIYIKANKK